MTAAEIRAAVGVFHKVSLHKRRNFQKRAENAWWQRFGVELLFQNALQYAKE